jgi:hypothetical protein
LHILEILGGLTLIVATLFDVFASVIMPGRVRTPFALASRLRKLSHPYWRRLAGRAAGGGRGATNPNSYAPLLLVAALVGWMALLMIGYGLVFHGLADRFSPRVPSLPEGVYLAGASMLTLGLEHYRALGSARWFTIAAGLSGISVATATLTFILTVQSALRDREPLVRSLPSLAGLPPSGLVLLENHAAFGVEARLGDLFQGWERWSAAVSQSHAAWPVLAYFRSADPRVDWITGFGAVLDAAALTCAFLSEGPRGEALLLIRTGSRAAEELCRELQVEPREAEPAETAELQAAHARLAAAGWAVEPLASTLASCHALRRGYAGNVRALVDHFGVEPPAWPGPDGQAAAAAAPATARMR